MDCDGGTHRVFNSAAQANEDLLETALANVISRAGDQSAVSVGDFLVRLSVDLALPGHGIEENQIFLEGEGLRGDIALRREGHAGAVENKAIVAAHLLH